VARLVLPATFQPESTRRPIGSKIVNIGKAAILEDSAVMLEWFDRVGSSADIQPTQKRSGFAPPRSRAGQTARISVNAVRWWVREGTTKE
jgi:hypothetical protein